MQNPCSPPEDMGYVYFIQGVLSGNVKIGYSAKSAHLRIWQISRQCGEEIRALAIFRGTRADERELHEKFKAHRVRAEWFLPAPEIFALLESAVPEMTERERADREWALGNMTTIQPLYP